MNRFSNSLKINILPPPHAQKINALKDRHKPFLRLGRCAWVVLLALAFFVSGRAYGQTDVARVSNDDEHQHWTYYEDLAEAFAYANAIQGSDVIVEILGDCHLEQSCTFDEINVFLTIRKGSSLTTNPTVTKSFVTGSMITFAPQNGTLTVENVDFNGGGQDYSSKTNGGIFKILKPTASFTNCNFADCYVDNTVTLITRAFGGAIAHYYAGEGNSPEGSLTIANCSFDHCVTSGGNLAAACQGGAVYFKWDNAGSTLSITEGVFQDCYAKDNGGALCIEGDCSTTIGNPTHFIMCSSGADGGAIYHNSTGALTIGHPFGDPNTTTFFNCFCTFAGGAIYTNSADALFTRCRFNGFDLSILGSSAEYGGAIFHEEVSPDSKMILIDSKISNCDVSASGGGIWTNCRARLDNDTITYCSAYAGGAVYSCCADTALTLKNGTRITNNTLKENPLSSIVIGPNMVISANDRTRAAGIYMSGILRLGASDVITEHSIVKDNYTESGAPSNLRLCTTDGVGLLVYSNLAGEIHIANPGGNGAQFGKEPQRVHSAFTYGPHVFKSDITNREPYGEKYNSVERNFYWRSYVCKITDASGNKLGLYSSLSAAVNAFTSVSGAKNIEMLVEEHTLTTANGTTSNIGGIVIPADMTLKTAAKMWGPETYGFPADAAEDCATIKRGYTAENNSTGYRSLFYIGEGKTFTLENVTLDGGSNSGYTCSSDGGLVKCQGNLYVYGCTLQNSNVTGLDHSGGAIYTSSGTLEIGAYQYDDGGKTVTKSTTIQNCQANGNGGGLNISGWASLSNTNIINCKSNGNVSGSEGRMKGGGGIYFRSRSGKSDEIILENCSICDNSSSHGGGIHLYDGKIRLRGNTRVENNKTTMSGGGAGIYAYSNPYEFIIVGVDNELSNEVNIKENRDKDGKLSNIEFYGGGFMDSSGKFIVLNSKMEGDIYVKRGEAGKEVGIQKAAHLNDFDDVPHIFHDNGGLVGYTADGDTIIRWRTRHVCKITDSNHQLLKEGSNSALYTSVARAFQALSNNTVTFKTAQGATATPAYVEMIEDHKMFEQVNITDNLRYDITLTTAGTADASNPYTPPTGTNSTRATLYDGALGGTPNFNITCTQHTLTVKGLNFDGRSGPDQETVPQIAHGMFRVDGDNNTNIAYPQLILVNDSLMNFNATGSGAFYDKPAVYMINGAKVEVQSGTVFKNCKALQGGAIECRDSQLTMTGGEITGCNAIYYGGAISFNISGNSTFNVSGLVKISNNTKGSAKSVTPDNVHFYDANGVVNIVGNGLECGSSIGVSYLSGTNIENKTIATGTAANCLDAFRKGFLFDDSQTYKPYCLNYGSYTTDKIYLIKSWNYYAVAAVEDTDYTLSDGLVATVETPTGLAYLAKSVNDGNDYANKTVLLNSNLNLGSGNDGKLWIPIGCAWDGCVTDSVTPFCGTFDGQGHTITGLTSYLPHKTMGLFGVVGASGEVKNVFINGGTINATYIPEENETVNAGGLVGLLDGGSVAYSESGLSLNDSNTGDLTMGGIAGSVTSSGTIHSCMAMPAMTTTKTTGSLTIGGIAGSNAGEVSNSYAYGQFPASNVTAAGGLVGSNSGAMGNCYARVQGTAPVTNFGWLAGSDSGSISNCYIPAGNDNYLGTAGGTLTDCDTYTATNLVNNKYGFGQNDQVVGSSTLVDTLNSLATGAYAQWTRTMASPINGDYPVLKLGDNICLGSKANSNFIGYGSNLNDMINTYNGVTGGGNIYLYDVPTTAVSTSTNNNVRVYIPEDFGILQGDENSLNARAGVTIKNTSGNAKEGASASWHMFSSAISNAPLGLVYHTSEDNEYMSEVANNSAISDAIWSNRSEFDPPMTTWNTTAGQIGYFPTDTPYGTWRDEPATTGFFDLYAYSEENYHWMNLKREGRSGLYDHWHTDRDDSGNHPKISYTNGTTMPAGKGYLLALSSESMLMADGELNNGTITIDVTKSEPTANIPSNGYTPDASKFRSINLVGNPYQSYLDFDAFATGNTMLENMYATRSGGEYIYYTANASSNREYTASQYVHPHQGFFVRVKDTEDYGTYTVTFGNTMRRAGTSSDFSSPYRSEVNYPLINLLCYDAEGHRDLTTVEVNRPEQGGGHKMEGLRTAEGTLSAQLGTELFQTAFVPEGINEVPVRFEAYTDGQYTLRWNTLHGEFSYLHLIDNMTGADVDMLAHSAPEPVEGPNATETGASTGSAASYTFTARTTDYTSRFKLVFDASEDEDGASTGSATFAYYANGEIVITADACDASLQVIDMLGRVLRSETVSGDARLNVNAAPGVYVLRLVNGENVKTQKIVIR